jgi:hypothetical protein
MLHLGLKTGNVRIRGTGREAQIESGVLLGTEKRVHESVLGKEINQENGEEAGLVPVIDTVVSTTMTDIDMTMIGGDADLHHHPDTVTVEREAHTAIKQLILSSFLNCGA